MYKSECTLEEAREASHTGPRRGQEVPIINELYEIQAHLERTNEPLKVESVITARLGIKLLIAVHDSLIDADLMERLMDYLFEHDEQMFWVLDSWRNQQLEKKYSRKIKSVD